MLDERIPEAVHDVIREGLDLILRKVKGLHQFIIHHFMHEFSHDFVLAAFLDGIQSA